MGAVPGEMMVGGRGDTRACSAGVPLGGLRAREVLPRSRGPCRRANTAGGEEARAERGSGDQAGGTYEDQAHAEQGQPNQEHSIAVAV